MLLLRIGLLFVLVSALIEARRYCGLRISGGIIVGIEGTPDTVSEFAEFQWTTMIFQMQSIQDKEVNIFMCTGSLIHPSVVLTSATCVLNKTVDQIAVRLGEWDMADTTEFFDHQDRLVSEIVIHSGYERLGYANDAALLFLKDPVVLMVTVHAICLPPKDYDIGEPRCFVSGWGKNVSGENGPYQNVMKKLELPIMPRDKCQDILRTTPWGEQFTLHPSAICAGGEEGVNMCKIGLGAPLVCPIAGAFDQYYQVGIVTFGNGCGENKTPVLYTNVVLLRDWIEEQLAKRQLELDRFFIYT